MITLEVACNNPDNGVFDHKAPFINVAGMEFGARRLPEPTFFELEGRRTGWGRIRLAGKCWDCYGSREWFGNWCWNAYILYPSDQSKTSGWYMVDFLKWLRGRELYSCDLALSDFAEWFDGKRELSDADLHNLIFDSEDELG